MVQHWLFFLAIFFLSCGSLCQENVQIVRSKKFDCSYLISNDATIGHTFITPLIDNKKEKNESIELLEQVSFVDVIEEEQYESLLCYAKNDPYVLYHVSLRGKGIDRISIEHLLTVRSDKRYLAIVDENKRMYVHGMVVDHDTIFLAVSTDEQAFGNDGSFVLALYMARSSSKPTKILPMFILPISAHDTYYNYGIQGITKLRSMTFEKRTQTVWCALEVAMTNSDETLLSALICIAVQSQQLQDETGQSFIAKNLSIQHINESKKPIIADQKVDRKFESIDGLQCMMTSTALPYIILAAKHNMNFVYALPLSGNGVASKQTQPKDIFFAEGLKRFVYRLFIESAASLDDVDMHTAAFRVGACRQIDGTKKAIKVFGDSVIMLIEKNVDEQTSVFELYKSIALFEHSGLIKGWTEWQLLYKQSEQIIDFELDCLSGEIIIVEKNNIKRAGWNQVDRTNPLLAAIDVLVEKDQYIQDATIQKILRDDTERILFGLVTNNTILFADLNNLFIQTMQYDEIGQCNTICISYDTETKKEYVFIGGTNGIAHIMLDEQHKIVTAQKILHEKNIKKIMYDNGVLYALTEEDLYRTSIRADTALMRWENIVPHDQKKNIGKLHNFIISNTFACLFSLTGLWVVESDQSIRQGHPRFEKFLLPQQIGIPVDFSVFSKTGNVIDCARGVGSNLFVLCANFSLGRAQLYRISLAPLEGNKMQLFDDIVLENKKGPFLNFGSLQKTCFLDGYRFLLLSSNKQVSLSTKPQVGIVMSGNKLVNLPIEDFQNARILYTGTNQCTGELFVVTEKSVYIYH